MHTYIHVQHTYMHTYCTYKEGERGHHVCIHCHSYVVHLPICYEYILREDMRMCVLAGLTITEVCLRMYCKHYVRMYVCFCFKVNLRPCCSSATYVHAYVHVVLTYVCTYLCTYVCTYIRIYYKERLLTADQTIIPFSTHVLAC